MNLAITFKQYDPRYIYFLEPTKNTIMPNSDFIGIIYSNNDFILNGIYLIIDINNILIESYYSKYKCNFNFSDNYDIINKLIIFEKEILKKYKINNKKQVLSLQNQLNLEYIKIFANTIDTSDKSIKIVLKVSGIWKNDNEYGITYKFIPL
jgi:hypothetical protein|tara:strand:+ start:2326 stop:2778 length:453 start_codon:yes stop_codon:yes gene_type:complete